MSKKSFIANHYTRMDLFYNGYAELTIFICMVTFKKNIDWVKTLVFEVP